MKRKTDMPRHKMPMQAPYIRAKNWEEVNTGFTPEMAKIEALRCLECKKPLCVEGCPVRIDIPGFLKFIEQGDFNAAAERIKESNALPAICGRVCPQERQCEKWCILGKKHEPVAIGYLERFAADYQRISGASAKHNDIRPSRKKVAIVGAGPAGLTAAGELARKGYSVTIFEALHRPGGVLVYGIPDFRLPKEIVDAEIEALKGFGVEIVTNYIIGRVEDLDELLARFNAVFLGTGAGLPYFLNIPGETLNGVYSANEFLTRVILMKAREFPDHVTPVKRGDRVVIVGCGDTAMDSARTALRMGPKSVTVIYRRSKEDAPARKEELLHAEEEGVLFRFLSNPVRFIGDENGWLKGVVCLEMEMGEPDESGRRRPVEKKGTEFIIEADTAVVAVGFGVNPTVTKTTPDLKTDRYGVVIVDKATGATSKKGVFAGGDVITGGSTVISAMGQAKIAAASIDLYLSNGD